jgi:membrane associated rhomboid family serine protease
MKTTQLLIGLNVLIFLVMLKTGGVEHVRAFDTRTLLEFGANYGPLVVRGGQWWRLVTSMFVHGGIVHLGMNMIAIYQCGTMLEPHFGRLRFALLYVIAGLAGSLASLAWHWGSGVPSVGASGAGCGLVAAGAVAGHLLIGLSPNAVRIRDAMLRWLAMIVVFGFVMGGIDNAAHIGGMAAGAGVAWLMDRRIGALKRARAEKTETGIGLEAFLLILLVGGCFALAARSRNDSYSPGELVNQGVQKSREDKSDEAIALYRRALQLDPNEEIAHYDLALQLWRKGQLAECAEHAREAARIVPKKEYQQLADECAGTGGALRLKLREPDGGTDD